MTPTPEAAPLAAAPASPADTSPIQRIAGQINSPHANTGLLAALRRFNPSTHGRHNLFEVQQVLLKAGIDLPSNAPEQVRWALVVHCLALARGAHRAGWSAGAGLFELGFSEGRLRQLVEADAPLLADLLPTLARRLGAAGQALDWRPLASLLWCDADPALADGARREIVHGYLRTQAARAKDKG